MTPQLILLILFFSSVPGTNCSPIYEWLVHCYRGNETQLLFPNTLQLLVELIRKIEDAFPTTVDIRTLSAIILHRLRIDGIERAPGIRESKHVTPYGANGIMDPKFQLILRMVSNVSNNLDLASALTPSELCQLHRMISTTVEPWERGDENRLCPLRKTESTGKELHRHYKVRPIDGVGVIVGENTQRRQSRCPIERGVVRSHEYDTFTPGTLIASIAAGLQPQSVPINEMVTINYNRTPWDNLETMQTRDTERELRKLLRSLDTMDNAYSAGLAGDLAEICVYQGPYTGTHTSIGVSGYWNDTHLPRIRYLNHIYHFPRWEMTDSEILGGIDGLFMSQKVATWINNSKRLKLSQVLDMYYSQRGLPFVSVETTDDEKNETPQNQQPPPARRMQSNHMMQNPDAENIFNIIEIEKDIDSASAFNTESNNKFRAIFEYPDLEWIESDEQPVLNRFSTHDDITNACHRSKILEIIDRAKLKDETYFLSQVLQFSTSSIAISDSVLRKNCDSTVDRFFNYSIELANRLPKCHEIEKLVSKPAVDLTVIIDGSRNEFENLQLISFLAEITDISKYGSFLSVIHGSTGEILVNRTRSVAEVFQQLRNRSLSDLINLSLSESMAAHLEQLSKQTIHERSAGAITGLPQVLLVTAQGQTTNERDFANARRLVQHSVERFPDLHYIFLANSERMPEDLMYGTKNWGEQQNTQYHLIKENSIQIENFEQKLRDILNRLPRRMTSPFCKDEESIRRRFNAGSILKQYHEDYLTPNQELIYRISPYYLIDTTDVHLQFDGLSYGTFTVCMARNHNFEAAECQTISNYETAWFDVIDACQNDDNCEPVYFKAFIEKSLIKCLETECRYPDQVRFNVRQEGLRCESNDAIIHKLANHYSVTFMASLFFLTLNLL